MFVGAFIFLFVIFILGLLMFLLPELYWDISSSLFVKEGEPTELSITVIRIRGVFLIVTCVIVTIVLIKCAILL